MYLEERPAVTEVELLELIREIAIRSSELGDLVDPRLGAVEVDLALVHGRHLTLIEVRRAAPQTDIRVEELVGRLQSYRAAAQKRWRDHDIHLILATSGVLTTDKVKVLAAAGIQLWDRAWIQHNAPTLGLQELAFRLLGSNYREARIIHIADQLQKRLTSVPCGRAHWSTYQKLCGEIFDYLFSPPLEAPILESSNSSRVNRRDIILPNYAGDGFWQFMRSHYRADYIVIDAKNHCGLANKSHVLQMANYLSLHGTGLFGMIVSRNGMDNGGNQTRREQWILYNKLVLVLTDEDLTQMLETKKADDSPESLIRQKIEDFRLGV
ncbi:hypothetical protein [Catellatospora methionotrophica]|uniref:hypothetical protein n=1 Tax=Catellatospora methionotrophica TaxID=121620 RepID=UPI003411AC15